MDNSFFLNRREEIEMDFSGKLPHWCQDGTLQFITMRLGDSLPTEIAKDIANRRTSYIFHHPKPWTYEEEREYTRIVGNKLLKNLDRGYGKCPFKSPQARHIVENAIAYYDGVLYDMLSYVLMPNHIHMLMLFRPNVNVQDAICRLKRYCGRNVNRLLNRQGPLWQREHFDRILRSPAHLDYCLAYIDNNPKHLPENTYTLYRNHALISEIKSTSEG